jgi:hypothetical protein
MESALRKALDARRERWLRRTVERLEAPKMTPREVRVSAAVLVIVGVCCALLALVAG